MPTVGNFNNDRILDGIKGLAGFPGGAVIKNLSVNAGDTGSIPGLGRSPGGRNAICSSILAWRIPWSEEPGGLQSIGSQRVRND